MNGSFTSRKGVVGMLINLFTSVWVLALAARITLFSEGGTIGAYGAVVVLWGATVILILLTLVHMVRSREVHVHPLLIFVALCAFTYRSFVTDGPTAIVSSLLFFACVVGLAVLYVRAAWRRVLQPGVGGMVL